MVQIPALPEALSPQFRGLLKSMVLDDPEERPNPYELYTALSAMAHLPTVSEDDTTPVLSTLEDCEQWLDEQQAELVSALESVPVRG